MSHFDSFCSFVIEMLDLDLYRLDLDEAHQHQDPMTLWEHLELFRGGCAMCLCSG